VSYVSAETYSEKEEVSLCGENLPNKRSTMFGLIPEPMFECAFQLATICVALLTAVVSFVFVPRG
jgi:hypothetical protein